MNANPSGKPFRYWPVAAAAGVLILVTTTILLMRTPSGEPPRMRRDQARCLMNVKQLGLARMMYSQDYDDRMPMAEQWHGALFEYVKNEETFRCPAAEENLVSLGFNAQLGGVKTDGITNETTLIELFDSKPGTVNAGGEELLPDPPRHQSFHTIGFLDMHAKSVRASELAPFQWKPTLAPEEFRKKPKAGSK